MTRDSLVVKRFWVFLSFRTYLFPFYTVLKSLIEGIILNGLNKSKDLLLSVLTKCRRWVYKVFMVSPGLKVVEGLVLNLFNQLVFRVYLNTK